MTLSTKDAIRVMDKVGVEYVKCDHHVRGFVVIKGKRILPIYCSHGNKDMPEHVAHLFRKSMRLSTDEFHRLRSCTMSKSEYLGTIAGRLGL